ncbi:hypothetical protein Tsp_12395 [Trichinella spiralis]|uniref:hypothetical protein n=1 Tax=Trichinella spiralis TaxID=6334 RepID=UPI0001EFDE3F|nr:hypothetical protein Tsp_12395 [Trichinella spiralis]
MTLAVTGNSACNSTINCFTPLDDQNLHQITRRLTREVWTSSQLDRSFSCCDIQYQTNNSLAQLPTLSNGMQPFAVRLSLNRILRQERRPHRNLWNFFTPYTSASASFSICP